MIANIAEYVQLALSNFECDINDYLKYWTE